jgi:2-methylisocitrate lyase-like PEP mutase family enzyme
MGRRDRTCGGEGRVPRCRDNQLGHRVLALLAAAARIARGVEVPVSVDAEAGYGMDPADLVAELKNMGAAGCNVEDTNHPADTLRDTEERVRWLAALRDAATADDYPLVINARVDVFLWPYVGGAEPGSQIDLVPEAVERANAYLDAGADCVYPIGLWQPDALSRFMAGVDAPVNVSRVPELSSLKEVAALGVARVSWAIFLFEEAMAHFGERVASLQS